MKIRKRSEINIRLDYVTNLLEIHKNIMYLMFDEFLHNGYRLGNISTND